MKAGFRITLIVSGSIAAYKSIELVRMLVKLGARVRVVLTRSALQFVTPLTFQTLSQNPVSTGLFELEQEEKIGHITLADQTDLVVVAPATADILAKAASGACDDLATSVLLATRAPILFAPAMNVNMWENSLTQENIKKLETLGRTVIPPSEGELACGWHGSGRLADIEVIMDHISNLGTSKDYKGCRVLVSAGPTRESLDPIRYLTNRSSGKMGYAIAKEVASRGAEVTLISGPASLKAPTGVDLVSVNSALEMQEALLDYSQRPANLGVGKQYIFMAAAVADYRPKEFSSKKIKSDKSRPKAIEFVPNPDILKSLSENREAIIKESGVGLKLVGFTAETGNEVDELLNSARGKLKHKGVDMIVGNFVEDSFERDTTRVWIIDKFGKQEELATADKSKIAAKIVQAATKI